MNADDQLLLLVTCEGTEENRRVVAARRLREGDQRCYSILCGDRVIGEVLLKHIDPEEQSCELGICLVNDGVKNRGYGTRAERLALRAAFDELGVERVRAKVLLKNTRSQHVLEKVGFRFVAEEGDFRRYEIDRARYAVFCRNRSFAE